MSILKYIQESMNIFQYIWYPLSHTNKYPNELARLPAVHLIPKYIQTQIQTLCVDHNSKIFNYSFSSPWYHKARWISLDIIGSH